MLEKIFPEKEYLIELGIARCVKRVHADERNCEFGIFWGTRYTRWGSGWWIQEQRRSAVPIGQWHDSQAIASNYFGKKTQARH